MVTGRVAALGAGLRTIWAGADRSERVAYLVGSALMLSGVTHIGVFLVVGGPWEGPVSFRKAVTFGLAFGLTVVTVTWVLSMIRMPDRRRRAVRALFVAACVVEVAL